MDKNYNVDDILSEIKNRKSRERAGGQPDSRPSAIQDIPAKTPPPEEEPAMAADEFAFRFEDLPPETPQEIRFDDVPAARRRPNPMEFTGHNRPLTDKAKMRPSKLQPPEQPAFSVVQPPEENAAEPIHLDKVMDFRAFRAANAPGAEQSHTRILPDINEEPGGAENAGATRLMDVPQNGIPGGRISFPDEEIPLPDNAPLHSAIDFSEYNSVEDRRDVATDIARVKLGLFIRCTLSVLLTAVLIYLAFSGKYIMPLPAFLQPEGDTVRNYLLCGTILTALLAIVNSSAIGGGLISLFKMRANSDTLAALAMLAVLAQGIMGVFNPESVDPLAMNLYYPVAALAMLFGVFGKLSMIDRIQTNFRLISSDCPKKAVLTVQSTDFCREFVQDTPGRPTVAYAVKAGFFTDFLGLSYSDKYDVGIHRAVAPVCLIGAIAVAVVCYLLTGMVQDAFMALTAILCVCATLSATFVENIPLGKLTKKIAPMGGIVTGNKAVEDYCDTAALVLTETDLFPKGKIHLHGIKTFSQGRIDDSIVDAASVICALDGALSPVFLEMIGGDRRLLKRAENIVYENGMGVSAWVDSRRILIGNQMLMQNHGISLPQAASQNQQSRAPEYGDMLYLSSSGEITAQFVVSYDIDEELATQLDLLAAMEKVLIIHANDANITPHRIWELYGYPEELICILPAERHQQYREMTVPRDNAIAEIVYTGRAPSLVAAIVSCANARSSILSATVLQLVQIVVGYGLIAFMAFMGVIGSLTIVQMGIYQLFWFIAIFLLQKAKHP